tara:strand:- start:69 stop:317 length:249 start_codon:yes stop_codon:yes gene_type:complete
MRFAGKRVIASGAIEANAKKIAIFEKEKFQDRVLTIRVGNTCDAPPTAAFLFSDNASCIAETTLEIDGGYTLNLVHYDPMKG